MDEHDSTSHVKLQKSGEQSAPNYESAEMNAKKSSPHRGLKRVLLLVIVCLIITFLTLDFVVFARIIFGPDHVLEAVMSFIAFVSMVAAILSWLFPNPPNL
jgi:hypothetical protein